MSIDRMNKKGQRRPGFGYPNGALNNISSTFGSSYLGCGEQASETLDDIINDILQNGQFDDNWNFEIVNQTPFHQVLKATSRNSNDPVLIIDPWSANFYRNK